MARYKLNPAFVRLSAMLILIFISVTGIQAQVTGSSAQYNRKALVTSPEEALKLLVQGNKRFADETILADQMGKIKRAELVNHGQHPIAVIVSCSDSRVPPELIFDQGLGDLFVIRVAGNVIDSVAMGSIEYAVEHLHTPLLMVLGHDHCGAVTAAVEGGEAPGSLPSIINRINPAVAMARKDQADKDHLIDQAILKNVNLNITAANQSHLVKEATEQGHLMVIGAVYDQISGLVGLTADALRTRKYGSRSPEQATEWQTELRSEFAKLMRMDDLMARSAPIALNPKETRVEDKGEYTLREIEINSTEGRRMKVILTTPKGKGKKFPAVVCIHGHGGKPYSVYEPNIYKAFGTELAKNKFVTIATVVSQHEIYEKDRTLMGERLWDLMRCVDYLESLPAVDPKRIGCGGLSLGGEMAMWLGAMDTRIKATVSSGFLTRMDQMEQGHCMCWKFPGLRELVDYADIYSLTAPRALQCQNGLKEPKADFTVELATEAMKEIRIIYSDLKHPEKVELIAHPGAHEIDLPSLMRYFKDNL